MKLVKSIFTSVCICLGAVLALAAAADAQNCGLGFSPNPGTGAVTIASYWVINGYSSPLNPALFMDTVTSGNSTVPPGVYNGWCIDVTDSIDDGPENYNVLMFSSCDPNLDAELANLGYTYHFTYPATDTNGTAAQWNELNYLLNHKASGATYWDVQASIWDIIGGPLPPNSFFQSYFGPTFPTYDTNLVSEMVGDAVTNAANWQPQCGDVISAILADTSADAGGDLPVQLTVIEVPFPCVPCISITKEVACLQPTNSCGPFGKVAAGIAGVGCTPGGVDQPAFCYQITITNCGTIPLTNLVVSDNLLGLVSSNFFTNASQVLAPGQAVTSMFSMSFAATATNTVTVTGDAALTNTVTNLATGLVISNGAPFSAFDSAVAQVEQASLSCNLQLFSPLDLDGNPTDNNVVLPQVAFYSTTNSVTLSIQVCNTGLAALSNVTINIPGLSAFNCAAPAPFSLGVGQCQTFQLCIGMVTCPAQITLNVSVTGQVVPDAGHCGVYDMSSTNVITACSQCAGTITCTNCAANVSGSVLLNCNPANTTLTGDSGLSGVPVMLLGAANNLLASTTTDVNGNYSFSSLASGAYNIAVTPPAGYVENYPAGDSSNAVTVQITGCSSVSNINFGYGNSNTPVLVGVPTGTNYGCNPANVATVASVLAGVTASSAGSAVPVTAKVATTTNGCLITQIFMLTATNTCGSAATAFVTNTWTTDTAMPVLNGVPQGKSYGCNPTNLLTASAIQAMVSASDTCSPATITVTGVTNTNGCSLTATFTILATNACGNNATAYVTNTWTSDTSTLVLNGVPSGKSYGCNPTNVPSVSTIVSGVTAPDTCSPATVSASAAVKTNGCAVTQVITIIATNSCGSKATAYVTNTWSTDATSLVLNGVPAGRNYGCNPATLPTVSNVISNVTAPDTCSAATVSASATVTSNGCMVTQVVTILATNACGSKATASVTNTWTIDKTPPVITGVPLGGYIGCSATNLPGDTNVLAAVKATDLCSTPGVVVTHLDSTNGCLGSRTFTITATDACGNMAVTNLTYTWTVNTTNFCTNMICCTFNNCNPGGGWLWCNAHVGGNPGVPCTLNCQNATLTFNCKNGTKFSYPVPNGQICFAANCTVATNWFDGTIWHTTLPCAGDSQIFLQGCGVPWNTNFANCQSVCWNGIFSCSTPGMAFNWQFGCAAYADTQPAYNTICPKACQQTSCQNGQYYNSGDQAGCPENHKPYCVGGGTGYGGFNCTGNWSGTATTCTFTNGASVPPVLNNIPANECLGLNPTNIPTTNSILVGVTASDTCSPATLSVKVTQTTNNCMVTQIFTITAINGCGNSAVAYVTNTWTTMAMNCTSTNTVCCNFNSQNPGSGWLWCNAHISGKPNKPVTVYCQNASITLTCQNGKTYTYPVPNGQINFATNCTTATNCYNGTQWITTLPCNGDDEIFLQGCAIPWNSAFANCQSVCWTGTFTCNTPGFVCNWQYGCACYSGSAPSCANICPKACHQNYCPNGKYYNSGDQAGCPENYSPSCISGGTGYGGSNCTGNWSNAGFCQF